MTRRLIGLAVVAALLVALAAGVASAAYVGCSTIPCYATGDSDLVYERQGRGVPDDIRLLGGNDIVHAETYGGDRDRVSGGTGYDKIYVNDGDTLDFVTTGTSLGGDWCIVDARVEAGPGCTRVTVD